mgnify:CR=1 FL=1
MRPHYLPYTGYFNLVDSVDKFVLLDDVQFEKRSWQQRNNIKLNNQKHLLTISVKSKRKFKQKISKVEIIDGNNIKLKKTQIFHEYNK